MNAVADDDDDDNDNDEGIVKNTMWISTFMNAVDDNDDDKTSICETVLHNLDTPPPGVEFWRTEVRFVLWIT